MCLQAKHRGKHFTGKMLELSSQSQETRPGDEGLRPKVTSAAELGLNLAG